MGLCESVYRRGGMYWWRRRLSLGNGRPSSYIHCSLRVRDGRRARMLARLVNVEADRIARNGMLTAIEQRELLKRFIDAQVGHLDGVTSLMAHRDAAMGASAEALDERVRRDRRMSVVYAADIGAAEAAKLAAEGWDAKEIEELGRNVRFLRDCLPRLSPDGAISAAGPNGLIGPSNLDLRAALGDIDVDATNTNVEQVRRLWLQAIAVTLGDVDRRHAPLSTGLADEVYGGMFGGVSPPSMGAPPPKQKDYTISGQIAALVAAKKGVDWKITKRGDQDVSDIAETYIFLGKILVKMIGHDDVRHLRPEHPMELRQTLQGLPRMYGKSPADWDLTFEQATANAETDGKPIGRAGTTLAKYINSFQSFVSFLDGSVISVPIAAKHFKAAKPKVKKQKSNTLRSSITDAEYVTLFEDETWCGPDVVHDSTYWVPLMTRYGAGRLEEPCGLLLSDFDFESEIPSYTIEENWMRTIKTEARRVPIHSELLRLGIKEHCEAVAALGYQEVFPDLRARGTKTAIGSLLDKKFVPILDRRLPLARASKKTQHSSRKTVNTELRDNKIDITIRCEILGHAQQGVNASVYTDPARDRDKEAIQTIANVTKHVPRRPISLSPSLTRKVRKS